MPHTSSFALAQLYIDRVRGDALVARSPTVGGVGRGTKDAIGSARRVMRDPLASSSERRRLFGPVANVSRRASPVTLRLGSSAILPTIVGASRRTMSSGPSAAALFHPTRRSVSLAVAEVRTSDVHDGGRNYRIGEGEFVDAPPQHSHDSARVTLVSGRLSPPAVLTEAPHTVVDIASAGDARSVATDAVAASSAPLSVVMPHSTAMPVSTDMPPFAFTSLVNSPGECEDVAAASDVEVASSTAMGPGDADLAQLPGSLASARDGAVGDAGQLLPGAPMREYPTEVPLPSPRANTTNTNAGPCTDADGGFFSPIGSMHYAAAAPMSIKDRVKSRRIRPVDISPLPMNGAKRRSAVSMRPPVALEDAVAFGAPAPLLGHPRRSRHKSLGDPSALAPPFGAGRADRAGSAMTPRHSAEKLGGKSPLDVPELNNLSSPHTLFSHTDSAGHTARPRRRSFGDTQHSLRTDSPPVVFAVPPLREPVVQVLSLSGVSEASPRGVLAGPQRRARPSLDGGSGAPPACSAAAAYLDATGLTSGRTSTRSSAHSQGGGGAWTGDEGEDEEEEDAPQPTTVCAAFIAAAAGALEAVSVLPFADEAAEHDVQRLLRLKMVRRGAAASRLPAIATPCSPRPQMQASLGYFVVAGVGITCIGVALSIQQQPQSEGSGSNAIGPHQMIAYFIVAAASFVAAIFWRRARSWAALETPLAARLPQLLTLIMVAGYAACAIVILWHAPCSLSICVLQTMPASPDDAVREL